MALHLIPAIDLKDGQCVRLRQGDLTDATVFSDDPAAGSYFLLTVLLTDAELPAAVPITA